MTTIPYACCLLKGWVVFGIKNRVIGCFPGLVSEDSFVLSVGQLHPTPDVSLAMLSSVLHSPRAVHVNIEIMRTFVRLRRILFERKYFKERIAA